MALPGLTINKKNGSAVPIAAPSNRVLVIGPGSSGTKETELFTFTNANSVNGSVGYGPGPETVQMICADTTFVCDYINSESSIAPESTEVSAANPTITVNDVPSARFGMDLITTVTVAGGRGEGYFQYSLDGGKTYTGNILIPSDGQFAYTSTGVSASFAASTHPVGNSSHYRIKGPRMTTTDLAACIPTVASGTYSYRTIVVADDNDDPVSGSALFNNLNAQLTTLRGVDIFTNAIVGVGGESILQDGTAGANTYTTVKSNMLTKAVTVGNGIQAVAEKANTILAIPIQGMSRPRRACALGYAAAYIQQAGTDVSRNPAAVFVPRWETPSHDDLVTTVYHDDRLVAPRTFRNEAGIFINQSWNKYTTGGESYNLIYKDSLANLAANTLKTALRPYINTNVRVLTDGTGRIDPDDAAPIQSAVTKALRGALIDPINTQGRRGYCTAFDFSIDLQNNILGTSTLQCSLSIVPFANISNITADIYLTDEIAVTPV